MNLQGPTLFVLVLGAGGALAALLEGAEPTHVALLAACGFGGGALLAYPLAFIERRAGRIAWLLALPLAIVLGGGGWALSQRSKNDDLSTAGLIAMALFLGLSLGIAGGLYSLLGQFGERFRIRTLAALGGALTLGCVVAGAGAASEDRDQTARTNAAFAEWLYVAPEGAPPPRSPYTVVRIDPGRFPPAPPLAPPDAPSATCVERKVPPLIAAVSRGDLMRVDSLLRAGAAPDICVHHGEGSAESALEAALELGDERIALRLLEAGADPNFLATNSSPPLALAVERRSPALVKRLIERGANVRLPTSIPLVYLAVDRGDAAILRLLLDAGASPHVGHAGKLAWDVAKANKREDLVALLRAEGATGEHGDALAIAAANGDPAAPTLHGYSIPAVAIALESGHPWLAQRLAKNLSLDLTSYSCDVLQAAAAADAVGVLREVFSNPQVVSRDCVRGAYRTAATRHSAKAASAQLLQQIAEQVP